MEAKVTITNPPQKSWHCRLISKSETRTYPPIADYKRRCHQKRSKIMAQTSKYFFWSIKYILIKHGQIGRVEEVYQKVKDLQRIWFSTNATHSPIQQGTFCVHQKKIREQGLLLNRKKLDSTPSKRLLFLSLQTTHINPSDTNTIVSCFHNAGFIFCCPLTDGTLGYILLECLLIHEFKIQLHLSSTCFCWDVNVPKSHDHLAIDAIRPGFQFHFRRTATFCNRTEVCNKQTWWTALWI